MKRQAPPFAAIEAFVAVGRSRSFKDAAAALNLSAATVTRRIQALEAHLRTTVVDRKQGRVALTLAGERYLRRLEPAFEAIRHAGQWTGAGAPSDEEQPLRLGVSESLATTWLMSGLPRFRRCLTSIDIEIVTQRSAGEAEVPDMELRLGGGDWPGWRTHKLFELEACVVSPKRLLDGRHSPPRLESLPHYPLLELSDPLQQWAPWLARLQLAPPYREPRMFDSAALLYEAAAQGWGVALGVAPFVDPYVDSGRLRRVFDVALPLGACYLAIRVDRLGDERIQAFRRWIQAEAARRSWQRQGLKLVVSQ